MSECTEGASGAVAGLLDVVTFCRLVDLRMELLLRSGVAVAAGVTLITVGRVTPLVVELHVRTRCGSERWRMEERWGDGDRGERNMERERGGERGEGERWKREKKKERKREGKKRE